MCCHVDLFGGELAITGFYAVALQDVADGAAVDPEASPQLVNGGSSLVCGNELLSLVTLDLLGSSGSGTPLALHGWAGGAW